MIEGLLAIGIGLLIAEILTPGFFLLWIGLAVLSTLFILASIDFFLRIHLSQNMWVLSLVFGALCPFYLFLGHFFSKKCSPISWNETVSTVGDRFDHVIGKEYILEAPIIEGCGTLRLFDTVWKIKGKDCPAKTHVRLVARENTTFFVEILKQSENLGTLK